MTKIYGVLKRLRAEGLALLYISHRMHEIAELADECTVFRNGRSVASYRRGHEDRQRDRRADDRPRVQRRVSAAHAARREPTRRRDSTCAHSAGTDRLTDISLHVHAGEVVGLGGLDGQGQRELLLALFGVLHGTTGEVLIDGKPVAITGPDVAKRRTIGMALIPEDRKTEGLMLPMSVRDNLSFAALGALSHWGIIDRRGRARRGGSDDPAACGSHRRHSTCPPAHFRAATSRSSSSASG